MDQIITIKDPLLEENVLMYTATSWTYTESETGEGSFTADGCVRHYVNASFPKTTYKVTFSSNVNRWDVVEDKSIPLYAAAKSKVSMWNWETNQGFFVLTSACSPEEALRQGRTQIETFIKENSIKIKAALARPKQLIERDLIIHKVK